MGLAVDNTDFVEQREDLLESIERDEQEVRGAIQELTAAARVKLNIRENIKEFPLAWLIGSFLVGLWLGGGSGGGAPEKRAYEL